MSTHWLIPLDGSEPSLRAVDHVVAQARELGIRPRLFLLHVQAPLSSDITRFIDGKTIQDYHREEGDKVLAPGAARLAGSGLEHSSHLLIGEAASAIVDFAGSKGCSMIIMGTHGFSSVMGLIMGSVATKVIHLAPMPVLLVK
ncbi:MAG: universal stress protein [Rhodoferax sp.]|jgi:nucleotide-binding universal stress UspA family protein|nr:universal stress protein [Rhodoferax sp.]